MRFPEVSGFNLLRRRVNLPADLQGEINIVFVAFKQWQQAWVDSWVPLARKLEETFPGVKFYELPVIQRMNSLAQTFINEGMRAGIPNQVTREKTITLYIDKAAFREVLELHSEETIWVLVVDRQGKVVWRTEGAYTQKKGEALLDALQEHSFLPQD